MSGKLKGVLIAIILIYIVISVISGFVGDMRLASEGVSNSTANPTILRTVFELWWVPLVLMLVAVFTTSGGRRSARRFLRRRRR